MKRTRKLLAVIALVAGVVIARKVRSRNKGDQHES